MADPEVTDETPKMDSKSSKTPPNDEPEASKGDEKKPDSNMQDVDIDNLDELLDSALADFDKPPPAQTHIPKPKTTSDAISTKSGAKKGTTQKTQSKDDMFSEIFDEAGLENAAEAMKAFSADNPELLQQLNAMLGQTAGGVGEEGEVDDEKFMESLRETMKSMSENASHLQPEDLGDDDLVKALSDLGLNMGDVSDDNFDPLIQNMMKSLLSKDVLYPSLSKINEVYPTWLSCHREDLTDAEYQTYEQQHKLIGDICREFEAESEEDSPETRTKRFDKIYTLMQEVQCGHALILTTSISDGACRVPWTANRDPRDIKSFHSAPDCIKAKY